jgi:hypothetical protein
MYATLMDNKSTKGGLAHGCVEDVNAFLLDFAADSGEIKNNH